MVEGLKDKSLGQSRVDNVGGWWDRVVVRQRVMVCVWLLFLWVRYFVSIDEVLDFMPKAGAVVSVMALLLVKVAILVQVKVVWHRVWDRSRV